ncbi:hypothetical protein BCR41DRAFT_388308 [Lobosporangium transversale]|uniref:Ion transport domain-containing protein n=1 Tax=Lobosporangium transversale TaxID=64571 RepID=A0A1Y2GGN9_9FUNG|nr:hypothetical protein BCR41DRAFT_388308 [Lobosporangium transversale]ORZ09337.1 hypothetical protein BCR41DRAFT_388308 [Lobosporangium transversale]|eukprot:XP_021878790.1 hypothetical protein BCR41DRAFT_388308 [Lobosporangium transversale]
MDDGLRNEPTTQALSNASPLHLLPRYTASGNADVIIPIEDNETSNAPTSEPYIGSHSSELSSSPALAAELEKGVRWYFKQSELEIIGMAGTIEQPPVFITPNKDWKCLLETQGGLVHGWYSMILGVTLSSRFTHRSDTLRIEAKQLDSNRCSLNAAKEYTTIAKIDEIGSIQEETIMRLKLHRQIEIVASGYIELSINVKKHDPSSLRLHYVELDVGLTADLVLYGELRPHHIIDVSHVDNTRDRTKTIHSYALNPCGSHAATLCFTEDGQGIIELWSLDSKLSEEPQGSTTKTHIAPIARGDKTLIKVSDLLSSNISMSASDSGNYVTIHSAEPISESSVGIEDTVENVDSTKPYNTVFYFLSSASKKASSRKQQLGNPCIVRQFRGYGKFHSYSSSDNQGKTNEYHITCSGSSIFIHNPDKKWSQIKTLAMAAEPNFEAASELITSLRGNCFAWTGNRGVISFWNIASMKQTSYISVAYDNTGPLVSLSGDGSLAAISTMGCISIYETFSGMKLGDYTEGLGDRRFEVMMDHHIFRIFDQDPSDDLKHQFIECKFIRIRDMEVIRTFPIHKDSSLNFPSPLKGQVYGYREGPIMNITKLDIGTIPLPDSKFREKDLERVAFNQIIRKHRLRFILTSDVEFILTPYTEGTSDALTTVNITRINLAPERQHHPPVSFSSSPSDSVITKKKGMSLKILLGPSHIDHSCIFLPKASRIVLVTGRYMQMWKLLAEGESNSSELAKLELVWALQAEDCRKHSTDLPIYRITSATATEDGMQFALKLFPKRKGEESKHSLKTSKNYDGYKVMKLVYPPVDNSGTLERNRISQGICGAIDMYVGGNLVCQAAVIQYLETLVRPSSQNPVSCIFTLCEAWTYANRNFLEQIMKALLPPTKITWIPDSKAIAAHKLNDPLKKVFQIAEKQPAVIGVAKVIMDYCISHASNSCNLSFLTPIFGSLKQVMTMFPEQAFDCIEQIAYIPVKERPYIIDNHKLAYPPRFRFKFWEPLSLPLPKMPDPIMQLHVVAKQRDPKNDLFTHPLFMASFDALWFYPEDKNNVEERTDHGGLDKKILSLEERIKSTAIVSKTTWWKSMFYMFLFKLNPRNQLYVQCYNFNLDFFDNPAIAALVAYKWNTIGFSYWLGRFAFQCIYYILVLVVAFMQVYYTGEDRTPFIGLFSAIIVMSAIFIWLEALQAYQNWEKYKESLYNLLDMFAFLIPMAAGIHQLIVIFNSDQFGNTRLVSFSVLVVFLHMLFELRVNEMVCKYVTIIQHATKEIQVFFVIFATGVIAFTIGILHLLHACPTSGCERIEDEGYLPLHFFGALSATYFMMGGRYDPVDPKFSSQDWAFHIMMMIFFFFTVILMLNVLIALINVAFTKGDDGWRLTWIESRLRYIEAAENMSYHIPGYRETYDCFPREIYFTATTQQMKAYQAKLDAEINKETGKYITNVDARVEQLQKQLQEQQAKQDTHIQELKKLLLQNTR